MAVSPRDVSARRGVLGDACMHAPSCRMARHRRGAHRVLNYQRRRRRAREDGTAHRRTCWDGFRACARVRLRRRGGSAFGSSATPHQRHGLFFTRIILDWRNQHDNRCAIYSSYLSINLPRPKIR
ncbi:hypothetical protein GQ55_3G187800 [Panicum hallii var. hallii]|uniref:Uncharacterized protein n=1 Tax=Panicum hallii var. hallii TaxID=1504633 RepID=A0A2T7EAZ3_9POAL|nr:hypothetical protein GQ55_3G187800 [Panicum hallii var. hallii]